MLRSAAVSSYLAVMLFGFIAGCSGAADEAKEAGSKTPATPAEAAATIDLRTFPALPNADIRGQSLAQVSYDAPGDIQKTADFYRQQLKAAGWKELPNAYTSAEYASLTFGRAGYRLSLSVMPATGNDKAGQVNVTLINHGNVNLAALPVPEGAKPLFGAPLSAGYVSELTADEARAKVKELLEAAGWEPYGTAGESLVMKQNGVQLNTQVSSAPAQQGKTVIQYSAVQMPADLPAPPDAEGVHFSDTPAQLSLDMAKPMDQADAWYRERLGKQGWEATTENPIKIDFKHFVIFRNKAMDLIEIQYTTVDEKTRLLIRYQTAAEVEEMERRLKEAIEKKKKEQEKEKAEPAE
jgi:hypothetical protein